MKVILQQNIEKLGSIGDIIEVRAGYARNYLIPKNLAFSITNRNRKAINVRKELMMKTKDHAIKQIQDLIEKLSSCVVAIPMKVTDDGEKLYGSVNQKMIKDNLEAQGIDIIEGNIIIQNQIKTLGEHEIQFVFEYNYKLAKSISVVNEETEVA